MDECIIFKLQIVESDTLHQCAVYTHGSHETASSIAAAQTPKQTEFNLLILFNRREI